MVGIVKGAARQLHIQDSADAQSGRRYCWQLSMLADRTRSQSKLQDGAQGGLSQHMAHARNGQKSYARSRGHALLRLARPQVSQIINNNYSLQTQSYIYSISSINLSFDQSQKQRIFIRL